MPQPLPALELSIAIEQYRRTAIRLLHLLPPADPVEPFAVSDAPGVSSDLDARFLALVEILQLPEQDVRILQCLVAAEFALEVAELGREYRSRANTGASLDVALVGRIMNLSPPRVMELAQRLLPDQPLLKYALVRLESATEGGVRPFASRGIQAHPQIVDYLYDQDLPAPYRLMTAPLPTEVEHPHKELIGVRLLTALRAREPIVCEIIGPHASGRAGLAAALAQGCGFRGVVLRDVTGLFGSALEEGLGELRRYAALRDLAPGIENVRELVVTEDARAGGVEPDSEAAARAGHGGDAPPPRLPDALRGFLDGLQGILFIVGTDSEPLLKQHDCAVIGLKAQFPSPASRARILSAELARWDLPPPESADLLLLGRRFALDAVRIRAAVRDAAEMARLRKPDEAPRPTIAELHEACRCQVRHDLATLSTRVTGHHEAGHMVVSADVRDGIFEIIDRVANAPLVYDEWGMARRHSLPQGLAVLFTGTPGTGKTMAASVLARELDMELFRVDLSRITSKWIGETEKNLSRIFDEAQRSNAIILFDEADSLFAKRTEVKSSVDRYANQEVNFLLQRLETFSGVVILTSNMDEGIDPAFKRRLNFRLRFEKPDVDGRASLWAKVFPGDCRLAADFDPMAIAAIYEMSGGNIRNAAVRAAFIAAEDPEAGGVITQRHCLLAAERESTEMGVLTRMTKADRETDSTDEPPTPPEPPPSRPTPRLVPITRPRNR